MKNSKKSMILLWISSTFAIILIQAVFNYLRGMAMLKDLGYFNAESGIGLRNITVSSLLLSILIAIIFYVCFMIIPNKKNNKSINKENEEEKLEEQKISDISKAKNNDEALEICRELNSSTEEVSVSISELSNFTESQAVSIEQLSASMEEMSSGIEQTAENIQQASDFVSTIHATISVLTDSIAEVAEAAEVLTKESGNARVAVSDGNEIITTAISEMNNVSTRIRDLADSIVVLGKSAEEIGKIIEVIKNIANQTNMLSLNASIEAARAGEYGRGFAVVARSIKELSDRSKDATTNIADIIRKIQLDIKEAVDKSNKGLEELETGMSLVKASGDSISKILSVVDKTNQYGVSVTESTRLQDESRREVMESVDELTSVVKEISATTMEESASIQQIASGVEEVKGCIEELAAGTEEITTVTSAISRRWKELMVLLDEK